MKLLSGGALRHVLVGRERRLPDLHRVDARRLVGLRRVEHHHAAVAEPRVAMRTMTGGCMPRWIVLYTSNSGRPDRAARRTRTARPRRSATRIVTLVGRMPSHGLRRTCACLAVLTSIVAAREDDAVVLGQAARRPGSMASMRARTLPETRVVDQVAATPGLAVRQDASAGSSLACRRVRRRCCASSSDWVTSSTGSR